MSALEQVSVAAMENQAFALMARLHVILRRQNGRIIDVEYMRQDPAYCRHILDLAMREATKEVAGICAKLDAVFFGNEGLFVRVVKQPLLAQRPGDALPTHLQVPAAVPRQGASSAPAASTVSAGAQIDPDLPEAPRVEASYVGRLR